jgi:hypothetical protein
MVFGCWWVVSPNSWDEWDLYCQQLLGVPDDATTHEILCEVVVPGRSFGRHFAAVTTERREQHGLRCEDGVLASETGQDGCSELSMVATGR